MVPLDVVLAREELATEGTLEGIQHRVRLLQVTTTGARRGEDLVRTVRTGELGRLVKTTLSRGGC